MSAGHIASNFSTVHISTDSLPLLPFGEALAALGVEALLVLAILAVYVTHRPRHIAPGPRTLELRDEPPAVVSLLTSHGEVTGAAAAGTLVDLAAQGSLEFFDLGGGETGIRLRQSGPPPRTAVEQLVLQLVQSYADSYGVTPARALVTGDRAQQQRFRDQLYAAVVSDARARGLSRSRYGRAFVVLAGVFSVSVFVLGKLIFFSSNDVSTHGPEFLRRLAATLAAAGGAALLFPVLRRLRAERAESPTAAGRRVAAAWLGVADALAADASFAELPPTSVATWHRLLAYGAAMGTARATLEDLPIGIVQSDRVAWSAVGGRWRAVAIHYPRRPLWGWDPAKLVRTGLLIGVLGLVPFALTVALVPHAGYASVGGHLVGVDDFEGLHTWSGDAAVAAVITLALLLGRVLCVLAVALGLAAAVVGAAGRSKPVRSVSGAAVRVRELHNRNRVVTGWWIAVDDGSSHEVTALHVHHWERAALGVAQGDWVSLTSSPVTGHVVSLAKSPAPPGYRPPAPEGAPGVIVLDGSRGAVAALQGGALLSGAAGLVFLGSKLYSRRVTRQWGATNGLTGEQQAAARAAVDAAYAGATTMDQAANQTRAAAIQQSLLNDLAARAGSGGPQVIVVGGPSEPPPALRPPPPPPPG